MARTVCNVGFFEPSDIRTPGREDGADQGDPQAPVSSAWGMGLVTLLTLASFSALAATTAIAWHLTIL